MARKKRVDTKGRVLKTGEIQRASDGLYIYRYTDTAGKRGYISSSSLTELREKEKRVQRDLQDGIDTSKGNLTLNELFREYMNTKTDLRDSSRSNYNSMWKNGVENTTLGRMPVSKIKPIHIKTFYADLVRSGHAENTVKLYHNMISPALELAVLSDIIRKNPARGCMKGVGGAKKERRALSRAEQNALTEYVKKSETFCIYSPLITFALCTGLRGGELTGLRWSDIDLKNNIIHVQKQLIYKNFGDGCRFHLCELKTSAGRRDIPLTDTARQSLFKQKELNLMYGKRKEVEGVTDFVFINSQGSPLEVTAVDAVLKRIVNAYNKENEKNADAVPLPSMSFHVLRHTFCSRMAEGGMDPKVLQYIMGHENISTTLDVYTNYDYEQIQTQVEEVQSKVKFG